VDAGVCSSAVPRHPSSRKTSRYYPELDQLSIVSAGASRSCLLLFLLLLPFLDSVAQSPNADNRELLHGSIFTAEGQPASRATVEILDLHGIKVASSTTDGAGNFEIGGVAEPGEYVFLVASSSQTSDQHVLLAQSNLELSLVLPATVPIAPSASERYIISANRLGVPAKARKHLVAAHEGFRKLNFDGAEREIDEAIRADSAFAQAFAMRAFIKLAKKDPSGAAEDARRAMLLDPSDSASFVALAISYNSLREFGRAEDAARRALSLRADSWQARLELAESCYGLGNFVLALYELDLQSVDFPDAHLVRGNVLLRLGRNLEAAEEFGSFLRQAPDDPRGDQIRQIVVTLRQANQ
jgi:tetratricopeptide (TPR) repeat protein